MKKALATLVIGAALIAPVAGSAAAPSAAPATSSEPESQTP